MNAFKHGLYAEAALLPGEDAAQFERHRLGLFRLYRPQTQEEAKAVDEIAECQWIRQRLRPMQAQADQQAIAPETDAAGRLCEPNAHQRIHSGLDVAKRRNHVDIAERRAFGKLMLQQKLRRQGLVAGARKLPLDCYMDAAGVVRGPVPLPDLTPMPEEGCQVPMKRESSGSDDGQNEKNWEQKERGEVEFGSGRSTARTGHVDLEPGCAGLSSGGSGVPARQHVFGRFEAHPPEWLRATPHAPPAFPGSGTGWAGYSVVGSL